MLPSDSWDTGSAGEPSSSNREGVDPTSSYISIDRLAVLLSPSQRPDDLARDLQLNDIVSQACLATGATGAAIALARGDEFICRASTGSTAPDLGVRLNIDHGLSAFCVQTGEVQRCDDSESDGRVDAEVCRHLGVRSVLVVPIVYGEYFLGIFEIFSPEPFAFYDRDIQMVIALSRSVLTALGILPPVEIAPEPAAPPEEFQDAQDEIQQPVVTKPWLEDGAQPVLGNAAEGGPDREPVAHLVKEPSYPRFKIVQKPPRDYLGAVLTTLVVALALLLGWMLGHGYSARKNAAREKQRAALAAQQKANSPEAPPAENVKPAQTIEPPVAGSPEPKYEAPKPAPSTEGLVVYQDGKIIFRQSAAPRGRLKDDAQDKSQAAPRAIVELTPEEAADYVTLRVEPLYPERARRQSIQGPVVLQAVINEDGSVQQLKVLNGNSDLAAAAIDAVRHWHFKPYTSKGKATQFATRITVNFTLPADQQSH